MRKLLIFFFSLFVVGQCFGQRNNDEPFLVPDDVSACESNPVGFTYVAREATDRNARVFAIFRAGTKESELTNRRRLNYVRRAYLQKWAAIHHLDIVYAFGEKSSGKGRIEFYVGSRLVFVMIAPKSMTPCLNCCGDDRVAPKYLYKAKLGKRGR